MRFKFFLIRKLLHVFFGILLLFILYLDSARTVLFVVLIVSLVLSLYVRKHNFPVISYLVKVLGKKTEFPGQGLITFNFSALFLLVWAGRTVAVYSVIILILFDSVGAVIGKLFNLFPIPYNRAKHFEGRFFIALIIFFILIKRFSVLTSVLTVIGVFFAETLDINIKFWKYNVKLDDNFLIPLVSGFVLKLL